MFEQWEPERFYWAKRRGVEDAELTIVQVSMLFGKDREYWTLTTPGSDQHHMPGDFTIVEAIIAPTAPQALRQAAE